MAQGFRGSKASVNYPSESYGAWPPPRLALPRRHLLPVLHLPPPPPPPPPAGACYRYRQGRRLVMFRPERLALLRWPSTPAVSYLDLHSAAPDRQAEANEAGRAAARQAVGRGAPCHLDRPSTLQSKSSQAASTQEAAGGRRRRQARLPRPRGAPGGGGGKPPPPGGGGGKEPCGGGGKDEGGAGTFAEWGLAGAACTPPSITLACALHSSRQRLPPSTTRNRVLQQRTQREARTCGLKGKGWQRCDAPGCRLFGSWS
jgi:hypothetical protein